MTSTLVPLPCCSPIATPVMSSMRDIAFVSPWRNHVSEPKRSKMGLPSNILANVSVGYMLGLRSHVLLKTSCNHRPAQQSVAFVSLPPKALYSFSVAIQTRANTVDPPKSHTHGHSIAMEERYREYLPTTTDSASGIPTNLMALHSKRWPSLTIASLVPLKSSVVFALSA